MFVAQLGTHLHGVGVLRAGTLGSEDCSTKPPQINADLPHASGV